MTPYARQWSRIVALHKQGLVTAKELQELGARHQLWFEDQHIEDATLPMINDLMAYANHIEEFGNQTATVIGGSHASPAENSAPIDTSVTENAGGFGNR